MRVDTLHTIGPSAVTEVLADLIREPTTLSVWLIGSRANDAATATSDWDLLVFSSVEPTVVAQRSKNIDVLRVGPSGRVLLEGKPEDYALSFTEFQWAVVAPQRASYVGKKYRDVPQGAARDYDEPRFDRPLLNARLLWAKE